MFGPCFVMQYFLFFLVLHHLAWEVRAGCFTVIVSWWHVAIIVLCLFLTVSWFSVQCVIVAFPGPLASQISLRICAV